MEDKAELLQEIIENSKTFSFIEDEILNLKSYYDYNKSININFIGLLEIMFEKLTDDDIDRILKTDEEIKQMFE